MEAECGCCERTMSKSWNRFLFWKLCCPPPYLHLSRLTVVYEREVPGSGLKSDTLVSKQLNSWGKWRRGPELESKEWTRHAGVGVSGGCRNGRTSSLEGGIQPDSEGDAVLLWGERMSPGFTLTVMNDVTEREEIHQISSKWIADLYESWREESKSCLRRSHVQSSVLSLTIWLSSEASAHSFSCPLKCAGLS